MPRMFTGPSAPERARRLRVPAPADGGGHGVEQVLGVDRLVQVGDAPDGQVLAPAGIDVDRPT